MTKYESAQAFIKAYTHWESLWRWRDLFKIGIHCESTKLLKMDREQILERTRRVLTPHLGKQYLEAVRLIDNFNADFQIASIQARQDMDTTHVAMLAQLFPPNPKGCYVGYDNHTACTLTFLLKNGSYVSCTQSKGGSKSIFGYFDLISTELGEKHCRFDVLPNGEVFLTTEEDCY